MQKNKTYTLDQAKIVLEKFCVYQERCHQDVINKLYKMHMITDAQDVIMVHLIQHNFLNEERFALSFARGKFHQKKWGKIKIANQLKFKKISTTNINKALKEIDETDYLLTLKDLIIKKLPTIKAKSSFEKRNKTAYYMQSKGYELPLIINTLDLLNI